MLGGVEKTTRKFRRWMSKNLVVVVGDDNDETDGRKWEKAGRNSSIVVLEARYLRFPCEVSFRTSERAC
jgi:hypothetical protein